MDYFDLIKQYKGNLSNAFKDSKTKFFIISFTSDWLYPTSENKEIVIALNAAGADVGFIEITSDKGHDSFLLDVPDFLSSVRNLSPPKLDPAIILLFSNLAFCLLSSLSCHSLSNFSISVSSTPCLVRCNL